MPRKLDIAGMRRGKLVAVRALPNIPGANGIPWLICCDCGKEYVLQASNFKLSKRKSCGCANSQFVRSTHGHATYANGGGTPTYTTWCNMIARCAKGPETKDYSSYGGRGILVCDRWITSYEAFLEDMGERPSPRHSIDRINNDGNYEPGNCRWATAKEQCANRRRPVTMPKRGSYKISKEQSLDIQRRLREGARICDIAKEFGVHKGTISRIKKSQHFEMGTACGKWNS